MKFRLIQGGAAGGLAPAVADPPGTRAWRKLASDAQDIARRAKESPAPGAAALAIEAQETAQGARQQATRTARGYTRTGHQRSSRGHR